MLGPVGHLRHGSPGAVLHGEVEQAGRLAQINTFGGGVNEIQRDIVATVGLGMTQGAITMKFWCATAFMNTTELVHIAKLLDDAGYHGLMVSDHLVLSARADEQVSVLAAPRRPADLGAGGGVARPVGADRRDGSVTTQLQFTTNIYIAGHRPILQVAKEVATAAVLSDGRVALGAGAGWMKEEFDLQGQDFANRGKRLNEMIPACASCGRAAGSSGTATTTTSPPFTLEPHPPEPGADLHRRPHRRRAAASRSARRRLDRQRLPVGPRPAAPRRSAEGVPRRGRARRRRLRDHLRLYEMPTIDMYQRAEDELGITGTMCMPWAMGNVSAGDRRDLNEVAAAYQGHIDRFAEEIVLPLR